MSNKYNTSDYILKYMYTTKIRQFKEDSQNHIFTDLICICDLASLVIYSVQNIILSLNVGIIIRWWIL